MEALDWGIRLEVPEMAERYSYIGIRMHDISSDSEENLHRCKVVEEIENPFSCTVMLKPENTGDITPMGWEMDKTLWQSIRSPFVNVSFPCSRLLLLKD